MNTLFPCFFIISLYSLLFHQTCYLSFTNSAVVSIFFGIGISDVRIFVTLHSNHDVFEVIIDTTRPEASSQRLLSIRPCSSFRDAIASVHPDWAARDREFANSAAQSGRKPGVFIEGTTTVC
jgi:hypothetical protein